MHTIKFQNGNSYEVTSGKDTYFINDRSVEFDCLQINDSEYHLIVDGKSIRATLLSYDRNDRSFQFLIGDKKVDLIVEDQYDRLLSKMGMEAGAGQMVSEFKAPMPGLVLDVMVASGDQVSKDQPILILEAMKMENALKAPGDGTISSVEVVVGDKVDKNQVLIRFE